LLAVENVIKNNLKAIKNNVMDNNIFMYDYDGDIDEIAAVHVEMQVPVAHVKWLGSYNGQGGQLYRAAMQEARRRGATSAEVEAKWNSDGFYRKMGLDTTQQGEYNPFTDSQLNKMAGALEEETLVELIGIKNQTRDLPRNPPRVAEFPLGTEWHKVLFNNGFRALGSGSFGTVWEHPKLSYVLKVFTADDIAYADWITTAIQHKNNPHMPRFVSSKPFLIVPGVQAVRMERLGRIDETAYSLLRQINAVVNDAIIERVSAGALIDNDVMYRRHNGFIAYCKAHPEFIPALDILVKFTMQPGYRPDIHDDNIMMRGPVIVFTDPVFDKKALQAHAR
jgi:hypothetical protein